MLGNNKNALWGDVICKLKSKIASWGGHWLTKAGKLTLIKFVLSALPIYQASFLLAPKSITDQVSKLICDFLWRGGKGIQTKFHLVNWDTVKHPILEGGLHIKDPSTANISLASKILWKIYTDSKHPVNQILKKKYVTSISLRNMQIENTSKGSLIWNLCRRGTNFFKKYLYRIPRNKKTKKRKLCCGKTISWDTRPLLILKL